VIHLYCIQIRFFVCVCVDGGGWVFVCGRKGARGYVHELYVNIFTNTYIIYIYSYDLGDFLVLEQQLNLFTVLLTHPVCDIPMTVCQEGNAGGRMDFARLKFQPKSASSDLQALQSTDPGTAFF